MANIKQARQKVEARIYKVMDKLDHTGQNTEYYKKKFGSMNDKQFYDFFKQDFPLKFQTKVFEIDPKIEDIIDALESMLKVPVTEEITLPFLYTNRDGKPVELSSFRADAMDAKSKFYAEINAKGMVSQTEVELEKEDSIARNLISSYLLGCHLNSNLINTDCYLPRTLKRKNAGQRGLSRAEKNYLVMIYYKTEV